MICAYCKNETNCTKEHIISDSVLELFPECDLTIDSTRNKQYKSDPVIKDVCEVCNSKKLNYIDDYAKQFINQYFINTYELYDTLDFVYEYDKLLKVLLKYTYNDLRSHKKDTSLFDENIMDFLLNKEIKDLDKHITILGGLWVNPSIMPQFKMGNQKLMWVNGAVFLDNSIIRHFDYHTGMVYLRKDNKQLELNGLALSYFFKFNSGLFIILFWDSEENKLSNEKLLRTKVLF